MALLGFANIRKDFFDYVYIILLQQSLTSKETSLANTVVCKIVHPFGSVWCKMALGEVGVALP